MPPNSPYSVHPGIAKMQDWVDKLQDTTGRSLDEWMKFINKSGPAGEAARRDWLKTEHKLGTHNAWWLAEKATKGQASIDEDTPKGYLKIAPKYVEEQYAGKKAALRPIYDRLLKLGLSIGKDAKACPCKTIVPLYREHVFAEIKPTTNTRIDLGLALAKLPDSKIPRKRIIDTGGKAKKDRITHRIPIESVDQIDDFVEKWLLTAYELDAK
jgi:hypothetical protein